MIQQNLISATHCHKLLSGTKLFLKFNLKQNEKEKEKVGEEKGRKSQMGKWTTTNPTSPSLAVSVNSVWFINKPRLQEHTTISAIAELTTTGRKRLNKIRFSEKHYTLSAQVAGLAYSYTQQRRNSDIRMVLCRHAHTLTGSHNFFTTSYKSQLTCTLPTSMPLGPGRDKFTCSILISRK